MLLVSVYPVILPLCCADICNKPKKKKSLKILVKLNRNTARKKKKYFSNLVLKTIGYFTETVTSLKMEFLLLIYDLANNTHQSIIC